MGMEQEAAVNQLKKCLTEAPVLQIYNQEASVTKLHTDASMWGYGAVLLQISDHDTQLHPVCFMSRKTTEAQQKYHSYELEVLAIIEAVKKLRVYLLGLHFKIITDCAAFTRTLEKKDLATRVARWALLLSEYNYSIEHRAGSKMPHVDSLSRYPICMVVQSELIARLSAAQKNDPEIQHVVPDGDEYVLCGELLYKVCEGKNLLVVPKGMQTEIIGNAHDIGHFGTAKTEALVKQNYFITGLKDKITNLLSNCVPCILANRKQGKQEGYLQSINKGDVPLSTWHFDFLGPLSSTPKGYKHILAIIDGFTKFCWLFPTKGVTAAEVVDRMVKLEALFGCPERLVTDRGSSFTSEDFKNYCQERCIRHILITTGMPRANGQVDRLNAVIANVLAKLTIDKPEQWYRQVPRVQLALNGSLQRSIGMTPFKLVFGVELKHLQMLPIKEAIEQEYAKHYDEQRNDVRQIAKDQILKVQLEQRKSFNKFRKEATRYRIGDLVAIKRTQFLPTSKLSRKFLGPYRITGKEGQNRYKVLKIGAHEGPVKTYSASDFMKPWRQPGSSAEEEEEEEDVIQKGESVGVGVSPVERTCDRDTQTRLTSH